MKVRSARKRLLLILAVLFKYTDKDHRMTSFKLNEHLRPHGLDCNSKVLGSLVRVMRECGINVQSTTKSGKQSIWIDDRPLSDDSLQTIVFAASTCPFIAREQRENILAGLRPLVTIYQEPTLQCIVTERQNQNPDEVIYKNYVVISDAVRSCRRLRFAMKKVCCNQQGEIFEGKSRATIVTPKCICPFGDTLFLIGYDHPTKRVKAYDLKGIVDMKLTFKSNAPNKDEVINILSFVDPMEYLPDTRETLIYSGPATFVCQDQALKDLYRHLDQPCGHIRKISRRRTTYFVDSVEIWTDTLDWLSRIPEHGIRIVGPEALVEAVRGHYSHTSASLLDPYIPANKKPSRANS